MINYYARLTGLPGIINPMRRVDLSGCHRMFPLLIFGAIVKKKNVLIIEDDQSMQKLIVIVLQHLGYLATVCHSAELALIGFSSAKYDLVITDLFMEGMGGIEAIRVMREQKPEVTIIAISAGYAGMSREDALRAAKKIGASTILEKPFTVERLTEVVSHYTKD